MTESAADSASSVPRQMTVAAGRFFAADWEASSFLEFFVDLQLRVAEDTRSGLGRTATRLADHARFALQMTLVRSVDSYLAYLGELEAAVEESRSRTPWTNALSRLDVRYSTGVPIGAGEQYSAALAHGNVRQVDRSFYDATGTQLFSEPHEVERLTRLLSLRNLIAHGRTFASDDLASLVDETVSVGGLGLRLQAVRRDLDFLRSSVTRLDSDTAERWGLPRPVTDKQLFDAISAAAKLSGKALEPRHQLTADPSPDQSH